MHKRFFTEAPVRRSAAISGLRHATLTALLLAGVWAPKSAFGFFKTNHAQTETWVASLKFHMIAGGPRPVGPFSHAVETDGFVFVTGQMPDTPDAPGKLPDG